MIILDFSQVVHAQIAIEFERNKNQTVNEDVLRHMILNQIRALNVKFRDKFGKMIIAIDGRNYWRKQEFEFYKANRKIAQKKSLVDWTAIYPIVNTIREEIKANLPLAYIEIESAEADDIIATAAKLAGSSIDLLIISSDKDFRQLQVFPKVRQWSPIQDKFIIEKFPLEYLHQHVIGGDAGDGIPDVIKPLDYYVNKPAKIPKMSEKRRRQLRSWFHLDPQHGYALNFSLDCPEDMKKRLSLNNTLVNLVSGSMPPFQAIANELLNAHAKPTGRSPLFYFNQHGLKQLASKVTDFYPRGI
jgi:hypothetical protein